MEDRDAKDLTAIADVLVALGASNTLDSEIWVRDVLAQMTLQMPRVVSLTRRYGAELAARVGVAHVRYEPGRYVRQVGPIPARICLGVRPRSALHPRQSF
jgi:hypothetical protein